MTTVHNIRGYRFTATSVRIDRRTRWGNPFVLGNDGGRTQVIAKHKAWLWEQIKSGEITLEDLASLKDKELVCWCAPKACHGDTLAAAADWAHDQLGLAPDLPERPAGWTRHTT